jgi:hypothetical protein
MSAALSLTLRRAVAGPLEHRGAHRSKTSSPARASSSTTSGHRIPEYLWLGRSRSRPYEFDDLGDFLRHVREESERLGCPLHRFQPKKGDALFWHADLVHGGAKREQPELTRKSLVTHFCPLDVDPEWLGQIPSSPKLEHAPGCFYCYPLTYAV